MAAFFRLPQWAFATLFTLAGFSLWFGIAWRNTRRSVAKLKASRPSPDEDAFLTAM